MWLKYLFYHLKLTWISQSIEDSYCSKIIKELTSRQVSFYLYALHVFCQKYLFYHLKQTWISQPIAESILPNDRNWQVVSFFFCLHAFGQSTRIWFPLSKQTWISQTIAESYCIKWQKLTTRDFFFCLHACKWQKYTYLFSFTWTNDSRKLERRKLNVNKLFFWIANSLFTEFIFWIKNSFDKPQLKKKKEVKLACFSKVCVCVCGVEVCVYEVGSGDGSSIVGDLTGLFKKVSPHFCYPFVIGIVENLILFTLLWWS
jgi:hypothetical protein